MAEDKDIVCPLCRKTNIDILEKISTQDINYLWKKNKVNTSYLLKNIDFIRKCKCSNCALIFFNPLVSGDDSFYSQLGTEKWYYMHDDKTEFEYSKQFIKDGDNILDIGSGRGVFFNYLKEKNISYTGLELSSKAFEYAKKDKINVIKKTIEDYALETDKKFDMIVSFQVLEHLSHIKRFIACSLSVLNKDGLLLIAVPNNDTFIKHAQNHIHNLPPHHLLHWNKKALIFLAKKFDLEIIDIYYEQVTSIHKQWFYSTIISKTIRNILFVKNKSINISGLNKIINVFSNLLSFVISRLGVQIHKTYNGLTMVIVLRKKEC